MSIWDSYPDLDEDDNGQLIPGTHVRAFIDDWGNHYPTVDVEPHAEVTIATIVNHCVPGHEDDDEDPMIVGPWLRLDIYADEAVRCVDWNEFVPDPRSASAVLNEAAVLALYHRLGNWLMAKKAHPLDTEETQ